MQVKVCRAVRVTLTGVGYRGERGRRGEVIVKHHDTLPRPWHTFRPLAAREGMPTDSRGREDEGGRDEDW